MPTMRVPFYDVKAQYEELASPIDSVMREVMASGVYALGPHHNALERELADLHGCKHGIALNSGTDALRIMMDAVGVGPGDEVITTAFTFVASTETIVQTGATPVFVDIDPETFMMDVSQIDAAVTERTKAILPIHLFGQMCDVRGVQAAAERHNLIFLEDAAQALGCTYEGVASGHFGVAAGYSFYVTKNLGAAGDAGLILTNDEELAEKFRSIRIHGMGRQRYYYDYIGYTSRMDELQAAILRVKLTRWDAWNARRAEIAQRYIEGLAGLSITLPKTSPGNNHTWHQFTILSPRRNELMTFLKECGVDTAIFYPVPIHFHAPYLKYGHGEGSLPHTEKVCHEVLNLPVHPHMTDAQVEHVIESIRAFE